MFCLDRLDVVGRKQSIQQVMLQEEDKCQKIQILESNW
jgi:hypothetical protein